MTEASTTQTDKMYRALSKSEGDYIIDLEDMFEAIEKDNVVKSQLAKIFTSTPPITVLIEGSAFVQNIDTIDKVLVQRNNPGDKIVLIDISPNATTTHQERIKALPTKEKYVLVQGDMNNIPLKDNFADIIINDCAINFNTTDDQNKRTLTEVKRVLKSDASICIMSVVVPRRYDNPEFGQDQELVPRELIDKPVDFFPFTFSEPSTEISRKCWPAPYFKNLFKDTKFNFHQFDSLRGKTYFPEKSAISYRRFALTK